MRQSGAALLAMLAILTLGLCSFVVGALNSAAVSTSVFARERNGAALAEAKSALIGYVAKEVLDLSESLPGRLPCPESPSDAGTANEGRAGSACSPSFPINKTVGRLPWRTLGLSKLVDAANEPLWYAVSPNWVLSTPNPPPIINAGTAGLLTVDGAGGVVAVIIAPGRPLTATPNAAQVAQGCQARAQARNDRAHNPAGGNADYRNYLECENASNPVDNVFATSIADNALNPVSNDQLVTVTAAELLNALQGPLAERLQRTVAPLVREYSSLWPGGAFLPYARPFVAPEANLALNEHCGPLAPAVQVREGLLPLAASSGNCVSDWTDFALTGSVSSLGCASMLPASSNVRCSFRYYRLNALGRFIFGAGAESIDVRIEATAPRAAASFRRPLTTTDLIVPPGVTARSTTLTPRTDGDARLNVVIRVTDANVCDDTRLGVACSLLGAVLTSAHDVGVEVPLLGTPILQGTRLSAAVIASRPPPYNLLGPVAGEPHYWFMRNQWYRYTYYAISGNSSAAAAGGHLTVKGLPPARGAADDKRFVLALMGPAVGGQVRGASATLANYMEGDNGAISAPARAFAYQVYAAGGNDRLATCPFNDGTATPCD